MFTIANFIDAGYVTKLCKPLGFEPRIDYAGLAQAMASGQADAQTYYYDAPPADDPDADTERQHWARRRRGFLDSLARCLGFCVRLGTVRKRFCRECGRAFYQQKRVDIQLAVDLTVLAVTGKITKACLLAGDEDFVPLVNVAREHGVFVHLFYGPGASRDLIQACDKATNISGLLRDLTPAPVMADALSVTR